MSHEATYSLIGKIIANISKDVINASLPTRIEVMPHTHYYDYNISGMTRVKDEHSSGECCYDRILHCTPDERDVSNTADGHRAIITAIKAALKYLGYEVTNTDVNLNDEIIFDIKKRI